MTDLNDKFKKPMLPTDVPFSGEQKVWLSGFFAGLHSHLQITKSDNAVVQVAGKPITILYGTQTGNAETCAYEAADEAKLLGLSPVVMDMDDVDLAELASAERILICISTYGEGEMPDNAVALWEEISSDQAPEFNNTFFSVLALGDTGYDDFCLSGKQWDERLEQLGATRIADRVDCDVDYEDLAAEWTQKALNAIKDKGSDGGMSNSSVSSGNTAPKKEKSKFGRKNPMSAPMTLKRRLTSAESSKEIMHFEFSIAGTGETYNAGDALNIIPRNQPSLVAELLTIFNCSSDHICQFGGESVSLQALLTDTVEIRTPSKDFIKLISQRSNDKVFADLVSENKNTELNEFLYGKDSVDLLNAYPEAKITLEEFLDCIKPIAPRAYSISSSVNAHADEVHLTIGSVRYNLAGREHNGVCSTYLADMVEEGEGVQCYFAPNKAFSVPDDDSVDIIMVGPGTGIAPFRGFLEERESRKATGKNWLFFGDRNKESDFIYREQLEAMEASGFLRLDLAFSRDQAEKIYVQTRIKEHGAEFFKWLENGAFFYICGDAIRMAKDVDVAIHEVVMEHGKMNKEEAVNYINALKKSKRYVRDVY